MQIVKTIKFFHLKVLLNMVLILVIPFAGFTCTKRLQTFGQFCFNGLKTLLSIVDWSHALYAIHIHLKPKEGAVCTNIFNR